VDQANGVTPRLAVLWRLGAPNAVVLRQGPSKVFCSIGWQLAKDKLTVGQWVKHKLYPERCDISADGKSWIYFALNGDWKGETMGAWTGLAKVPYMKCVKMWPLGNTWGGGGMLDDNDERVGATRVDRLVRNGWFKTRDGFTKPCFRGWTLVKHLERTFSEAHELVAVDGRVEEHYDWQWADYDEPRDRVVFASGGCIYSLPSLRHKPKLLFDANGMTFEAIAAPY
jgi:hypothetical protein